MIWMKYKFIEMLYKFPKYYKSSCQDFFAAKNENKYYTYMNLKWILQSKWTLLHQLVHSIIPLNVRMWRAPADCHLNVWLIAQ